MLSTRRRQSWICALCFIIFVAADMTAQPQLTKISGSVSDPTGAAIPNASVEFESSGDTVRTVTDVAGNFTLISTKPYGTLSIRSPGFNTVSVEVSSAASEPLRIKLDPATLIERILIAAEDERIPATPTSQFAPQCCVFRRIEHLEGLLVPQVPRNQFNFQVSYSDSGWFLGAQGRFVSRQFDDDQNTMPLERFFTLDADASRSISEKVRLFVAFQNLTGTRYQISSTPVFTVGPPLLVRLGARISLK